MLTESAQARLDVLQAGTGDASAHRGDGVGTAEASHRKKRGKAPKGSHRPHHHSRRPRHGQGHHHHNHRHKHKGGGGIVASGGLAPKGAPEAAAAAATATAALASVNSSIVPEVITNGGPEVEKTVTGS